jgi:CRP-like cAMP-binding protein
MRSAIDRADPTTRIVLPAGATLITEGTLSGRMYILAEGSTEVVRGEIQVAVVDEPGSFFGEMSVLLKLPHTATVRALSPVTVYAFDDAEALLRSDPDIALAVARMLAQRLNAATTYLVDLKRQYSGSTNHLGIVSDVLASLLHHQEADFTPGSDRQPGP